MPEPTQKRREEVESVIRAILVSHKDNITVEQLHHDYFEYEGEEIPFREFNYDTLFSFLKSLRNVLTLITKFGKPFLKVVDTEKSRHVRELVEGQKSSKRKSFSGFKKPRRPTRGGYSQGTGNSYTTQSNFGLFRASPASRVNDSYSPASRFNDSYSPASRFNNSSISASKFPNSSSSASRFDNSFISSTTLNNTSFPTNIDNQRSNQVSNMSESNNCQSTSNETCKLQYFTGEDCLDGGDLSDYDDFDYVSVENNKSSPSSEHEKKENGNPIIRNENEQTSCNGFNNKDENCDVEDENSIKCNESTLEINPRVKERLRIIIQKHPDGIWCADLPNIYHEESGLSLDYDELGFQSVLAFASQLRDVFHCVRPKQRGDFKLYNAKKPLPDIKSEEIRCQYSSAEQYRIYVDDDPEPIPSRLDPSQSNHLFPDGVMLLNERVGQILVDELCVGKDYEEVILSEVFSPSFFWIQLRKRIPKFKKFMDNLHDFYMVEYKKYQIPVITLGKGLNVACVYAKKWHRGIIKDVLPDGTSLVHFYDYGTIKSYEPKHLYYLHRRFSNLPAQAIPCGLFNLRPINSNKWHKIVTWKFIENTSCPLIAEVITKNEEDNSALITLTNTLKEDDFHINDWMINDKLATLGCMNVDLKNLCDYEESKLPKKCDMDEEELKAFDTFQESTINSRPPPGFQLITPIPEEFTKLNGSVTNNNNNSESNEYQELLNLHKKIKNKMDSDSYKALLRQLDDNLIISDSTDGNSKNSTAINSKTLDQNDFVNSTQECQRIGEFPKSVEELFSQIPKFNENIENQVQLESWKNVEYLDSQIGNIKNKEKNSNHNNLEHQENIDFKTQCQNLIPESEEFLKILEEKIHREKLKKNENLPKMKETNPFKMFEQSEFIPKLSPTNPFINNFNTTNSPKEKSARKSCRKNLKSFLDSSENSFPIINESKNDSSCQSNTNIFTYSDKEDENTNFSFLNEKEKFIPSNIFSPVIDACKKKLNEDVKIFFESAPIMYDENRMENKIDNLDGNFWKPISSVETSRPSESSVKKNGISFKINKSNNPANGINQNKSKPPVKMEKQNIKSPIDVAANNNYEESLVDAELLAAAKIPLPPSLENSPATSPTEFENMLPSRNLNDKNSSIYVKENSFNNERRSNHESLAGLKIQVENLASDISSQLNTSCRIKDDIPQVSLNHPFAERNLNNTNPFVTSNPVAKDKSSVCYMCPITTKERILIIVNVDNEGWLISDEFVEAFMNIKLTSIMLRALKLINVQIPFKTVDRYSYPSLIEQLDFMPLNVLRDSENKIIRPIHLTPLKFALKILLNLNIINGSEWDLIVQEKKISSNTIINDIIKLIKTYMSVKTRP